MVMRHATPKGNLEPEQVQQDRHNELVVDFMRIELELADTFCKLALESHSPEKARRHKLNARRALDGAFHALIKVHMNKEEMESIVTRIEGVKALLESLEAGGSTHPSC
jgi:hypothetical protein